VAMVGEMRWVYAWLGEEATSDLRRSSCYGSPGGGWSRSWLVGKKIEHVCVLVVMVEVKERTACALFEGSNRIESNQTGVGVGDKAGIRDGEGREEAATRAGKLKW
jgi:hypothetical protein